MNFYTEYSLNLSHLIEVWKLLCVMEGMKHQAFDPGLV
jgi:hypothetical protein